MPVEEFYICLMVVVVCLVGYLRALYADLTTTASVSVNGCGLLESMLCLPIIQGHSWSFVSVAKVVTRLYQPHHFPHDGQLRVAERTG